MEGPPVVVVEGEDGMGKEPFLLMLYVMPVVFLAWVLSSFGVKSLLACAVFFGYLYWINKQLWESEKRRIQFEERKKINAKRAMNGGETLRWLNDGLKAMWPICMEKFASQYFFKPMAPWFLNKYKPKFVKEVTLLSLNLGGRPPEFSLIRVLPASQDGDDVVFVAAMEFLSDKDMNAQMTVQMRGFKTTFYISRLCMKGTVKFSVKFVKGWPVLGRVRFSFENTPIVNMTARPYNKNGIDMRIIPGAANWLEETLGTALEQSVVEPYMLVIDMEKLVSNTLFPARPPQAPEDFFCVEHKSGFSPTVLVEILEAGELKSANGAGLPDPSVEVMLGAHKEKTKPLTKTTNPTWANEVQRIPIVNWELPNLLTMRVISKPKTSFGRQIELGICSISVKEYRDGLRHVETIALSNVPTGWLRFAITVDHLNNHHAQVAEKPHSNVGSQPTTQDIHTVSPPDSASTRHHTRNSSTETLPQASEDENGGGGTSEVIKMPYGGDGAFSIQCPGQEKPLEFPDPQARKSKETQRSSKERDSDSKVKWSIKGLTSRKRNASNASLSEREMKFNEHAGYSSSLDRSTELKVYHGAVKMELELSPDMNHSRDAPDVEPLKLETCQNVQPLKLETCQNVKPANLETCQNVQPLKSCQIPVKTQLGPSETDTKESSARKEVKSSTKLPEKVQNSKKNAWWKRWRRKKGSNSSKEPDLQPGFEVMSDVSASQSFRKDPDEATLKMVGHFEESGGGNNILVSGRSQSCRQDPSHVKKIVWSSFNGATSLRFDPSSPFLNTIHERPQTLVP